MDEELLDGNSKANWGLGGHHNGRRINTSLLTLSVQPERTDARVGLLRGRGKLRDRLMEQIRSTRKRGCETHKP